MCRRSNRLFTQIQTFSKRKTNAMKCHLLLLCKGEDFYLECCSMVPVIALKLFWMSCSLFSNKWILMLKMLKILMLKVNCAAPSCCMLSVGVAIPNTSVDTEFICAFTNECYTFLFHNCKVLGQNSPHQKKFDAIYIILFLKKISKLSLVGYRCN